MSKEDLKDSLRRTQYLGASGYTRSCLVAIDSVLSTGWLPKKAIIISTHQRGNNPTQNHLFLFIDWDYFPVTVVPSGFGSGYPGEGPKGFSLAICMIRDKGIPIFGMDLNDTDFERIDRGEVKFSDDALFKHIILNSEEFSWPWPGWTIEGYEQLLERGQLWRECSWRQTQTDTITKAISEIDIEFPLIGHSLRLARKKIDESSDSKEYQQVGILVRDSWIEFSHSLCEAFKVDTKDIQKDKVMDKLKKLKLGDELIDSCRVSLNLSLKVQHDRQIRGDEAQLCLFSSIFSMCTLIHEFTSNKEHTDV